MYLYLLKYANSLPIPLWEQRNMFGARMRIIWEEQLVDHLIHCYLHSKSGLLVGLYIMCVKDLSYKELNSDLKILMKTPSYCKLWVVDHVLLNLSNNILAVWRKCLLCYDDYASIYVTWQNLFYNLFLFNINLFSFYQIHKSSSSMVSMTAY